MLFWYFITLPALLTQGNYRPAQATGRATPISKDIGLPTHPLTAIPAAVTPQRLFYSGLPLNAALLPQVGNLAFILLPLIWEKI